MLISHSVSHGPNKHLLDIVQEQVATIQALLTSKDIEKVRNTILADLKDSIKIMCNQTGNPNKTISDAEEAANEAAFLSLYIDIVNGLLHTQTTSKTLLIEILNSLANDFKSMMQSGSGLESKRNYGNNKNAFYFLSDILQSQSPVLSLQKAIENIKEYAEIAKNNIQSGTAVPVFSFPIVNPNLVIEHKSVPAKVELKEKEPVTQKSKVLAIIEPLKEPFLKIMSLTGDNVFLDRAARLAALVTSHYMYTLTKIPLHKVALVITNTLLDRIAHSSEKERVEHLRTVLEFFNLLSLVNENIIAEIIKKPTLLSRVQQSIQLNLDTQTLIDFNKRYNMDNSKIISVPESKRESTLTPISNRRASTQTLVLKTLGQAISSEDNDDTDEAIIEGGQVDDPTEGIDRPEETRYEAQVIVNPDLLPTSDDQEEAPDTTLVAEPLKIRVNGC